MESNITTSIGLPYSKVWREIHWVFLMIVILVGLVGNGFVCFVVLRFHHLHKPSNYFLVSLAASDILVCLFSYPFRIYFEMSNFKWFLGRHTCQFYIFIDILCISASIVNLSLVSIDRYISLAYPLRYKVIMRARRRNIGITIVWLYSFILGILSLSRWSSDGELLYIGTCVKRDKAYYTTSTTLGIILPLVILIVLYYLVFKMAIAHQKQIRGCTMGSFVGGPEDTTVGGEPASHQPARRRRLVATELKAARTLIIVVGTFLVCWLPGIVMIILIQYSNQYIEKLPVKTQEFLGQVFLFTLPPLNSALNPFIYTYFNTEIRKVFKSLCWRLVMILGCADRDAQTNDRRVSRVVQV